MEEKQRKRYTSEDKVAILKEHLVGKKPVSELCERHGIAVNMFYRWQEEFFAKAAGVFDGPRPKPAKESKIFKPVSLPRKVSPQLDFSLCASSKLNGPCASALKKRR